MSDNDYKQIITRLGELKQLLSTSRSKDPNTYLTGREVEKMLGISTSTLQTWRTERTIPYTIIRNKIFYKLEDIHQLMEMFKVK